MVLDSSTPDAAPPKPAPDPRRAAIIHAAMAIIVDEGWHKASMIAVASRARVSKETLYTLFGNRAGLFAALVGANAQTVAPPDPDAPCDAALAAWGADLLAMMLGRAAIAINRVAIAEALRAPDLARMLAAHGREAVLPQLAQWIARHQARGVLRADADPAQAAGDFLALLKGDAQLDRLLGLPAQPDMAGRARHATAQFLRLYAMPGAAGVSGAGATG